MPLGSSASATLAPRVLCKPIYLLVARSWVKVFLVLKNWITMEFQPSYTWHPTWIASRNFKVTVIMNGQRINRSGASWAFLCCSWQNSALFMAENMSQTWPPQLCWAQPPLKSPAESGACLRHSALLSHQIHFLYHYQLHNGHICLLEMCKHRDSFVKPHGLHPPSGPLSTSSYPPCFHCIPHSVFSWAFSTYSASLSRRDRPPLTSCLGWTEHQSH